jgi:hypothetical protein
MQPSNVSNNVPNLDLGEYFTILRGRLTHPEMRVPISEGEFHVIPAQYDHGWDGAIFKVLHIEYTFVACEVVFPSNTAGMTIHLNVSDLELMPLSKGYVAALRRGKQFTDPSIVKLGGLFDFLNVATKNDVKGKDFP